jgi:fibronectin type 3 domain-containing protein
MKSGKLRFGAMLLLVVIAAITSAVAQTQTHSVTLSWNDTLNPAGTTYNVYRADGLCSGSPVFAKIASAVALKTYKDTTVTVGNYCFQVTAVFNSIESSPSNSVNPTVGPFAVQLNATVP